MILLEYFLVNFIEEIPSFILGFLNRCKKQERFELTR